MVTVEIQGNKRNNLGSKGAKEIRKEGGILAVLYGGEDVVHFTVTPAAVKHIIYTLISNY